MILSHAPPRSVKCAGSTRPKRHHIPPVCFRMANHGRTIILSIHQPRYSIYRLFDNLTLLVSGKQVNRKRLCSPVRRSFLPVVRTNRKTAPQVYHGPAQRALDYFSDIGKDVTSSSTTDRNTELPQGHVTWDLFSQGTPASLTTTPPTSSWTSLMETQPPSPSDPKTLKVPERKNDPKES